MLLIASVERQRERERDFVWIYLTSCYVVATVQWIAEVLQWQGVDSSKPQALWLAMDRVYGFVAWDYGIASPLLSAVSMEVFRSLVQVIQKLRMRFQLTIHTLILAQFGQPPYDAWVGLFSKPRPRLCRHRPRPATCWWYHTLLQSILLQSIREVYTNMTVI